MGSQKDSSGDLPPGTVSGSGSLRNTSESSSPSLREETAQGERGSPAGKSGSLPARRRWPCREIPLGPPELGWALKEQGPRREGFRLRHLPSGRQPGGEGGCRPSFSWSRFYTPHPTSGTVSTTAEWGAAGGEQTATEGRDVRVPSATCPLTSAAEAAHPQG